MSSDVEKNVVIWLQTVQAELRVFYHHLADNPPDKFIWFLRAGDERLDTLTIDGTEEPDIIYFDVECWADTLADLTTLCAALRATNDFRGAFGTATIQDAQIQDQRDDYEPQATAETLPAFCSAFRLVITGYEA